MSKFFSNYSLTKIALFVALISIGAFISVPMYPVPITFQNFFVIMAALLLTPIEAFTTVVVYILLGLVGLPIFSGLRGGLSYVFVPSFGFLIGFAIGAYVISKIVENNFSKNNIILSMIVGEIIFYIVGLTYMYFCLKHLNKLPDNFITLFKIGMIPFIPGDIIKMVIALLIAPRIKEYIKKTLR